MFLASVIYNFLDLYCLLEIHHWYLVISNIIFYFLYFYNVIDIISIFLEIDYHDVSFFLINELISLVIIVRCKEYMYVNVANNNTFILLARSHTQQTLLHVFACVNVVSKLYTVFWISIVECLQRITSHTCLLFFSLFIGDIVYDLIQHLPWDCFFL